MSHKLQRQGGGGARCGVARRAAQRWGRSRRPHAGQQHWSSALRPRLWPWRGSARGKRGQSSVGGGGAVELSGLPAARAHARLRHRSPRRAGPPGEVSAARQRLGSAAGWRPRLRTRLPAAPVRRAGHPHRGCHQWREAHTGCRRRTERHVRGRGPPAAAVVSFDTTLTPVHGFHTCVRLTPEQAPPHGARSCRRRGGGRQRRQSRGRRRARCVLSPWNRGPPEPRCAGDEPLFVLSVPYEALPTARRAAPMENFSTYYLRLHTRARRAWHMRMACRTSCRLTRALPALQMAPATRLTR